MDILLMHKNDKVAQLKFTDAGYFSEVVGFYKKELMPPSTRVPDSYVEQRFKNWMANRCLHKKRNNYLNLLTQMNVNNPEQLYFQCYGASLTDTYWFRPLNTKDVDFGWEDINFFKNPYSDYVANVLYDDKFNSFYQDFSSPNLTLGGEQNKIWYQDPDTLKSSLIKFGTKENKDQEIYNEIITSFVCDALNINHSNYELIDLEDSEGKSIKACVCDNFCNENLEFLSAQALTVEPGMIGKNGILKFINKLGFQEQLYKILTLDYLMCNPNRSMDNIGFLREADTLKPVSMSPIFSSRSSLWLNCNDDDIGHFDDSKPFDFSHERQIKLVEDFSWLNIDKLNGLEYDIKNILSKSNIPSMTIDKICIAFKDRVKKLYNITKDTNIKISTNINENNEEEKEKDNSILSQSSEGFGM